MTEATTAPNPPLCRDCIHAVDTERSGGFYAKCGRTHKAVHPLTGFAAEKTDPEYCSGERTDGYNHGHECGSVGRYFEAKPRPQHRVGDAPEPREDVLLL